MARPRPQGAQRDGRLVAPPRRVRQALMHAFFGVTALLFAASAAMTIAWCASMSAMGEMPMPGGWTMSMAWMRMPGQTWLGAAASFLGMWVVMMAAMMLPSLAPMLWRYRQAVARVGETRLGRLTALVGVGYFFVWTVFGMAAFPLGVALAAIEMQQPALARAVPIAVGVVVLIAGSLQLTAWKARHLACWAKFRCTMRMRHPSPAARAIRNNPAPTTTAPMARATRSPAGARRSTVMAAATTAIARKSMTPMTKRIAIRPAQQWLQWRPRRRPCRQAVPASAGSVRPRPGASRQQAR